MTEEPTKNEDVSKRLERLAREASQIDLALSEISALLDKIAKLDQKSSDYIDELYDYIERIGLAVNLYKSHTECYLSIWNSFENDSSAIDDSLRSKYETKMSEWEKMNSNIAEKFNNIRPSSNHKDKRLH